MPSAPRPVLARGFGHGDKPAADQSHSIPYYSALGKVEVLDSCVSALLKKDPEVEVGRSILRVVKKHFDVAAASLFVAGEDGCLHLLSSTDPKLEAANKGEAVFYRSGEGLTGWVWKHGRSIRLDDVSSKTEWRPTSTRN